MFVDPTAWMTFMLFPVVYFHLRHPVKPKTALKIPALGRMARQTNFYSTRSRMRRFATNSTGRPRARIFDPDSPRTWCHPKVEKVNPSKDGWLCDMLDENSQVVESSVIFYLKITCIRSDSIFNEMLKSPGEPNNKVSASKTIYTCDICRAKIVDWWEKRNCPMRLIIVIFIHLLRQARYF